MEFLVEFEVTIPNGTADSEAADREAAEASAAAELVAQGHLVRVWKLPGATGERKILGLYRADTGDQLNELLDGLPLRDWMTVMVTRLDPHPSDPAARAGGGSSYPEFLVTMTTHVPDGTPEEAIDDIRTREAARARELVAQGHLLRLWRPPLLPGEWRSLGLFAAADIDQLQDVLASMPLHVWRTDEVTPLSPHPNDPGRPSPVKVPAQD